MIASVGRFESKRHCRRADISSGLCRPVVRLRSTNHEPVVLGMSHRRVANSRRSGRAQLQWWQRDECWVRVFATGGGPLQDRGGAGGRFGRGPSPAVGARRCGSLRGPGSVPCGATRSPGTPRAGACRLSPAVGRTISRRKRAPRELSVCYLPSSEHWCPLERGRIMEGSRRSVVALALAAALFVAGIGPALAHSTPSGSGCRIGALTPTYDYHWPGVTIGHSDRTGCTSTVSWLEGKLMHVQAGPLPDLNMQTITRYSVTSNTYIHPSRQFWPGMVYRSLTRSSSGASFQSGTSTPWCDAQGYCPPLGSRS